MKEFEVEVRIRNNLLKQRREELGMNCRELSKRAGIQASFYSALECMKKSPLTEDGEWRPSVLKLAEFHGLPPEDLFPPSIRAVTSVKAVRKMDFDEIADFMGLPSARSDAAEKLLLLRGAVATLKPRQREILRQRFEEDKTYEEIAVQHGLSRERIRGVTEDALSKLRRQVSPELREHWEESDTTDEP